MKLRFHENSLRLRLSQSEVARLAETGRVENTVSFAPGQALVYSVETAAVPEVAAAFEDGRVRVMLPSGAAKQWMDGDQVGLEGSDAVLNIAVEKDFQCLHKRAEDSDGFPNPLAHPREP